MRKANLPEVIRLIDRFFAPARPNRRESDRVAGVPAASAQAPVHVALDPLDPEPGQAESVVGAVEPNIAHTLALAPEPAPEAVTPIVYSLTSLFADEQHRILQTILNQTIGEMEDSLRKIYEDHASLLHFLTESGMNPPPALALAAGFALNVGLRRALEAEPFDPQAVAELLGRAATDHVTLDAPLLSFAAAERMKRAMVRLESAAAESNPQLSDPGVLHALHGALAIADLIRFMPFEVVIWQAQNIWNDLLRRTGSQYWSEAWKDDFRKLGQAMNIAVDELVIEEGVLSF